MNLDQLFLAYNERLGTIRYAKSFGWICMFTGRQMFGGYNSIDNDILVVWLIVSPQLFDESLKEGFQKFDFGKTWVETEVAGQEDIERIWPFILDAFNYTKQRKTKKIKR